MITFINRKKVKPTIIRGVKTWGYTYKKAGFIEVGETKGGLLALQVLPKDMPAAESALPYDGVPDDQSQNLLRPST
jgi:hypothetical protein